MSKVWPGSISITVLLTAFCVVSSFANEQPFHMVNLADCDFWIGTIWNGQIQPLGSCFKGDWSTPEILPIPQNSGTEATHAIPIPSDWTKGKNPPPLKWRIVCSDMESKNISATRVMVRGENILLKPDSAITGSSCVALSGDVSIRWPSIVPAMGKSEGPHEIASVNVKEQAIQLVKERYEDGVGIALVNSSGTKIFEISETYGQ